MFLPEAIYLDPGVESYSLTQKVLSSYPDLPKKSDFSKDKITDELNRESEDLFGAAKKILMLSQFKGSFLKKCPGISPGMVCCNYYVVNLIKNCSYDCSYCFLQDFLENNPVLNAYVNVEDLFNQLEDVFSKFPDRSFRVGTGELTDSLALDTLLPYSDYLIPFFNAQSNAILELKTKSDQIDNLLKQPDPTNIIVSWSLNPESISVIEEKGTPTPSKRIEAARLCQEKGYKIGFHFDPIILFQGWEKDYEQMIHNLFQQISPTNIEWISLGSFRYRPNLKKIIKDRHPETQLFTQEHTPGEDGKFRYLRPLRNHAYETIRNLIKKKDSELNVYLCMETKEIWEGVTGKMPRSDKKLDQFFDL